MRRMFQLKSHDRTYLDVSMTMYHKQK